MENKNRFICALTPALLAGLMAGCSAYAAVRALGFETGALPAYLAALLVAYAAGISRGKAVLTAVVSVGALAGAGVLFAANSGVISEWMRGISDPSLALNLDNAAPAGMALSAALALLLGVLFGMLVRSDAGRPFVILIFLAAIICSLALNEDLTLWIALPGLIAGAAAFAVPMGKNEGPQLTAVLPAVVLAVLALLIVPAARTTWAPLENLAVRIRAIVEDYVHFTQQRIVFSINEQGYDRAGMVNNVVVAMLGGPANPHEEEVMQVTTGHDLLLRGTIKRSYTGYSWVDDQIKARYLYYDFTHRGARGEVFDQKRDLDDTFETVEAQVEILSDGTSTLFVPAHMESFSMDLENAVYYNSTGEIFLTRDVAPGDSYAVTGRVPVSREALLEAAARAESQDDDRFDEMQDIYTALPAGIDSRVYALAVELTQGKTTAAQKAYAIEEYLAQNYRYTLEGGVPAAGQDFVSYFLMDAKEGYCSYFASAMTVLCRIAGVPARYVEGYAVKAEADGVTTVTGEDAHAWVEVYLNGVGWTAYDPTARAEERQAGEEQGSGANISDEPEKQDTPFGDDRALDEPIDPTPSPTPTLPPQEPDSDITAQDTPTPEPNGDARSDPTPTPELPDMSGQDQSENPFDSPQDDNSLREPDAPARKNRAWLWILIGILLALVLAALAVLLIRRRLENTDPVRLAAKAKSAQLASLILYRGVLTLLAQMGQAPASGETPQAFAARVSQAMPNEAYEAFVAAVVRSRYSGKPVDRASVELGKNAYLAFLSGMRRREKLRFIRQRLLHGLGSFELIP